MAKKTKFTRVAVAGLTASDGRTIEAQHLIEMAASYNPATYTARMNVEHIRNLSADGPFPALGDVIALKTQIDDIEINGKIEKRQALYAQIDGNEKLESYIAADQKKFTSIEIEPNFNGSGKAYLMGLAATDSPASLGTQALKFAHAAADDDAKAAKASLDARKQHTSCFFSAAFGTTIEFDATETPTTPADGFLDKFFARLDAFGKKDEPKTPEPTPDAADPTAAVATMFRDFSKDLKAGLTEVLGAERQANQQAFSKLTSELAAVRADIATTPEKNFTQRPAATGGDGLDLADC